MTPCSTDWNARSADAADLDALALLWFEGWQDAHADILPAEIAADRTLVSFRERLAERLADVRTIGSAGRPIGFSLLKENELYQFYVDGSARGTGVAMVLMTDALARLRRANVGTAWLACAIGNDRAARFYERCGWHRAGVEVSRLPLRSGVFALNVWRYEITL